jgi:hypothetical protein
MGHSPLPWGICPSCDAKRVAALGALLKEDALEDVGTLVTFNPAQCSVAIFMRKRELLPNPVKHHAGRAGASIAREIEYPWPLSSGLRRHPICRGWRRHFERRAGAEDPAVVSRRVSVAGLQVLDGDTLTGFERLTHQVFPRHGTGVELR